MRSILKFKIDDRFFALPTYPIKKIFLVQEVVPLDYFPPYVLGAAVVQNKAYPLICLNYFITGKLCQNVQKRPALIIEFLKRSYAFVVDEIIELDEVESRLAEGNNLYQKNHNIYQELSLESIFQRIDIDGFSQAVIEEGRATEQEYATFLIFDIADELFAIDDALVDSIGFINALQITRSTHDGLLAVYKNRPLKLIDLAKKFKKETHSSAFLIVSDENKEIGFLLGEVHGLSAVQKSKISKEHNNTLFEGYFLHQGKMVSILSRIFFLQMAQEHGLERIQKKKKILAKEGMQDFLVVEIAKQKFAIPLMPIVGILDFSKTKTLQNNTSKGRNDLILYKQHTVDFFDWNKIGKEFHPTSDSKIIVFDDNKHYFGFGVDSIVDIITVPKSRIATLANEESLSAGIVFDKKERINLLNLEWKEFKYLSA